MFIYLSKVVPALLVYPPGLTILLLLVAASLRKRMPRFAVGSFILAVVSLYALSTHAVAEELQRSLESTYTEVSVSSVPTADVILVLGGYLRTPSRQHPTADLTEESGRLRAAARLFQANKAPLVLLSGGNLAMFGEARMPEARAAKEILHDRGIPLEAILVEDGSQNTRENAVFSAPILTTNKAKRLILVTSATHMPRAVAVFHRLGIDVIPFPTDFKSGWGEPELLFRWLPDAESLMGSDRVLKEWIGLAVYRARGWA